MKSFLSLLSIIALVYFSFYSLMPRQGTPDTNAETEFSIGRALISVKEMTKEPHFITSKGHANVRNYLIKELENLGLTPQVQDGYMINAFYGSVEIDQPKNILAKIDGSGDGKALLLMSHYDSALMPSYGASDAASGIATILESLRAYIATGAKPKNDIIVLFTDAEEVGLDGAKLFVREHPWAKNVGLALNFEARGSGGPSNMIVETNGGNANLIKNFIEANPQFPVASSLMYSIYKMLPNDTDSTILREEGDIDSFFFAFIDDHFDYHTAQDNFERLDRNTLQHQGTYLMALLSYFADADLSTLKAKQDYVYVNFPFIKMISYPFSWVFPMVIIAILIFIALVFYGIRQKALSGIEIGRGFVSFLLSLTLSGLVGYFGWQLLLKIYPHYNEIKHGFTYNGHIYIIFFVVLSLAISFYCYHKFQTKKLANSLVAPLFLWLVINLLLAVYLKGGAYFIIPVFFGLLSLWVLVRQEKPSTILLLLLAVPALFIFPPLIQFFSVGLGLKMLVISAVFTVLLFGLLIPVIGFYKRKKTLSYIGFFTALILFFTAHSKSSFSENRKKPNSLVFYQNVDEQKAYWITYDNVLDDWTNEYLGEKPENASKYIESAAGSKYNTGYSYAAKAPLKNLNGFKITLHKDSVIDDFRHIDFTLKPQRDVNLIQFYTDKNNTFTSFSCNGNYLKLDSIRRNNTLFKYFVYENDSLNIAYSIPKDKVIGFNVLEYSYNLMTHPDFTMTKRKNNMMPKPFVYTDAIVLKKTIVLDSLKVKPVVVSALN